MFNKATDTEQSYAYGYFKVYVKVFTSVDMNAQIWHHCSKSFTLGLHFLKQFRECLMFAIKYPSILCFNISASIYYHIIDLKLSFL